MMKYNVCNYYFNMMCCKHFTTSNDLDVGYYQTATGLYIAVISVLTVLIIVRS